MQDLKKHECFELEILELLNNNKLLENLIFCGGTMLRLCHGLNRYSVDLDFWITKEIDSENLYEKLKTSIENSYTITDHANKFNTILFEIKSPNYPRALKIEIRKEPKQIKTDHNIAYSPHSNIQVFLKTVSLNEMMTAKIECFLARKEIRDVFDMEFLYKKGFKITADNKTLEKLLKQIDSLTQKDFSVKLGSVLEKEEREYYKEKKFTLLKEHILNLITGLFP